MKLFRPGRYAAVTSTAALVLALAGTSYAAVQITGHDIKNGTVTSADVKNDNLKLKDFSSSAKAGLTGATGATGATGPAGAPGPVGPQGPVGPSNAYSVYNDNSTVLTAIHKTILSLALAPGSYVVNAKTLAFKTGANPLSICYLAFTGVPFDYAGASPDPASYNTIANQLAFTTTTGGTIYYNCYGNASLVYMKKLTALKVGALANSQGPNVAREAPEPRPST